LEITAEPLANRQLRLTVKVDEERIRQAMHRAARKIAKEVDIPGFRKGKAPYDVIVHRFGEDVVRREAADDLVNEVYREALEQEQIEPYDVASLDETVLNPMTFTFTVPLPPTVDLGNYRAYRLKPPKIRVGKKEVQQVLETIREENAILEAVERPTQLGDGIAIDLVGRTADGVEFLRQEDVHLMLEPERIKLAKGFAEAILGMAAGEERTFKATLPDDFPREDLRGQEVEFTVKMREVYKSILPNLDDDLARTVGNFDSLKELMRHVREQLEQAAQQQADEAYAGQVLKDIVEQAQVEYPPVMLEEELDRIVKEVEQRVKRETRLSLEDFLRFQNKTMDDLRDDLQDEARARLKRSLVLAEVVRREGLEADAEEIDARIEETSTAWGIRADEMRSLLSSEPGRRAVRSRLLANKAVQRLVAIATGEMAARKRRPWSFVQRLIARVRGR
jgi:trigger factor